MNNTIYDKIYIQYIGESHMHSMILKGGCRDGNGPVATGHTRECHPYDDVIMSAMASQISSITTVYSSVYSGANQRKHQSSASLAFVRGIHRWPVNSPHKWPVTRQKLPFDDVIMTTADSGTAATNPSLRQPPLVSRKKIQHIHTH